MKQINEVKRMQQLAGVLKEEDTWADAAREEAIDGIIKNMKQEVQDLIRMQYGDTAEGVLDRVKKELSMHQFEVPDTEDLPF